MNELKTLEEIEKELIGLKIAIKVGGMLFTIWMIILLMWHFGLI